MTSDDKFAENEQLDKLNKQDSGALYLSEEGFVPNLLSFESKRFQQHKRGTTL